MVFSSVLFLFYFLPITIILYFISGRFRQYVLLVLSLLFYLCGGVESFPLILISIFLNYVFGLIIGSGYAEKRDQKKIILFVAIFANLGLLFYFKYFNFVCDIYTYIQLRFQTVPELSVTPIVLPIGISFFTFQGLAYVIDVYRGQVTSQKNIVKVALYISMFPQLIAGPIVRYSDICRDMDCLFEKTKKRGIHKILPPIKLDELAGGLKDLLLD